MRNHDCWVYIPTNKHRTTLYIGITNNIARRLAQHRYGEAEGFTKRYHLNRLVWLDLSDDWEQQPKFYDRPWETEEMTRNFSSGSEGNQTVSSHFDRAETSLPMFFRRTGHAMNLFAS